MANDGHFRKLFLLLLARRSLKCAILRKSQWIIKKDELRRISYFSLRCRKMESTLSYRQFEGKIRKLCLPSGEIKQLKEIDYWKGKREKGREGEKVYISYTCLFFIPMQCHEDSFEFITQNWEQPLFYTVYLAMEWSKISVLFKGWLRTSL